MINSRDVQATEHGKVWQRTYIQQHHLILLLPQDDKMSATTEPSRMDPDNTDTADRELHQTNKEAKVPTPESEALSHLGGTGENVNADIAFCNSGEEMTSCAFLRVIEVNPSKEIPESNYSMAMINKVRHVPTQMYWQ